MPKVNFDRSSTPETTPSRTGKTRYHHVTVALPIKHTWIPLAITAQSHSSFGRCLPEERASFPMGILLPQGFHRDENNDFSRAPAESFSAATNFRNPVRRSARQPSGIPGSGPAETIDGQDRFMTGHRHLFPASFSRISRTADILGTAAGRLPPVGHCPEASSAAPQPRASHHHDTGPCTPYDP